MGWQGEKYIEGIDSYRRELMDERLCLFPHTIQSLTKEIALQKMLISFSGYIHSSYTLSLQTCEWKSLRVESMLEYESTLFQDHKQASQCDEVRGRDVSYGNWLL